ncbi:helix-turn-helix domain-containing protein [Thermopolyspora sp. NPDC052614]|uniref:sigma-54-dependent Fis family transcriptional regulator n=1 Tax=Thermopolyspora sp. NPDC052614 TaxID=3155682 RepID=UPI00342A15F2
MTASSPRVPRTNAEWELVREAKLEVLRRDPRTVDPADFPAVRPEVVASWRRSMLAGVDPEATEYVVDDGFESRARLGAAAQPIMNRLKDEISDLSCWGFLADRACRLLTVVVGDFPLAWRVHRQNLRPGMCFAEDLMGTNGLGCAHETQQAFIISGTEHYRTDTEILTTTGVIIRDPFTKRYAGTLGVHCLREYGSAALLPLVVEIGRSIETQLLASRTDGERAFFDAFSAAERRHRAPVIAVSRRLFVVSTRARALVREADEELLRRLAEECGSRGRTVRRDLSSGVTAAIQVLPVPQPKGEFAAVLVLRPVGGAAPGAGDDASVDGRHRASRSGGRAGRGDDGHGRDRSTGHTGSTGQTSSRGHTGSNGSIGSAGDASADFRGMLSRALRTRRPILLTGERGCGKRHEARAALRALGLPGGVVELDGGLAHLDPDGWLRRLVAAAGDEGAAVLLGHVTDLPAALMSTVADLVTGARARVVGTTTDDSAEDSAAVLVRESFPVLLTVPPLRRRRHEFADLCADLLAGLGEPGEHPATLTPRAVAALMASDWPGNIRQLLQVLATARVRATGPAIDLRDLPARHGRDRASRPLDEVRAAERHVLEEALRRTGGDRNAVARHLGVSRATVYRKLKRHELY